MNLGLSIRAIRHQLCLTQAELGVRAGTSQTAIAAYENGRRVPSLPTLERIAAALGTTLRVELVSLGADVHAERPSHHLSSEERRSLWLHRVIAARIQADPERAVALAQKKLAAKGRADQTGRGAPWRQAWEELLAGPLDEMLALLCSTSIYASQLRQTAPFAGLLTPQERWAAYLSIPKDKVESRTA